jgi:hypothetical protein
MLHRCRPSDSNAPSLLLDVRPDHDTQAKRDKRQPQMLSRFSIVSGGLMLGALAGSRWRWRAMREALMVMPTNSWKFRGHGLT